MINKGEQGMEPEGPLERRRRLLLLRMRHHDGGVQVHHHLPGPGPGRDGSPMRPGPRSRRGPRLPQPRERRVDVPGEGIHQPRHRGVRGHQAEQRGLGAQRTDISQAVPAQGHAGRQVQHRLARIVHRPGLTPRLQLHGQRPVQPHHAGGLHQQHRPGLGHQTHPVPGDFHLIQNPVSVHPRSASPCDRFRASTTPIQPPEQALRHAREPAGPPRSSWVKARG